jgi:hypothetical protein
MSNTEHLRPCKPGDSNNPGSRRKPTTWSKIARLIGDEAVLDLHNGGETTRREAAPCTNGRPRAICEPLSFWQPEKTARRRKRHLRPRASQFKSSPLMENDRRVKEKTPTLGEPRAPGAVERLATCTSSGVFYLIKGR